MSFSAEQAKIIQYLYGTTSLLSIVGSLFIITNFLHFKTFKTTTLTLIFFLGLSDFGNAIFNSLIFFIFSPTFESASYNLCQAQAIGKGLFNLTFLNSISNKIRNSIFCSFFFSLDFCNCFSYMALFSHKFDESTIKKTF